MPRKIKRTIATTCCRIEVFYGRGALKNGPARRAGALVQQSMEATASNDIEDHGGHAGFGEGAGWVMDQDRRTRCAGSIQLRYVLRVRPS